MKSIGDFSFSARCLLKWMTQQESYFLSAQQARVKGQIVNDLQNEGYLTPHTLHGDTGYVLTGIAKSQLGLGKSLVTHASVSIDQLMELES